MMTKRGITLTIILLILITPVLAITIDMQAASLNKTSGLVRDYPNLQVIQLKYEPYPVEPGESFTLWLKIKNIANDDVADATVEIVNEFPFSVKDNKKTLGKIKSHEEFLVKFENIKVDPATLPGEHELKVKLNRGGGYVKEPQIETLTINIRTINQLLYTTISSSPNRIQQGSPATLQIDLENLDSSMIKNLIVKLNLPSEFVTIGSTDEKRINRISSGEQRKLTFEIMAIADAESKAYSIPIELTYSDITGTLNSKNNTFGLLVGANIDYDLNIEEADILTRISKGKVVLGLSNTGPSEIKYSIIELMDTEDYTVIGNRKTYLGNLESDDFETVEFEIFTSTQKEKIPLLIRMEYKDSYNQKVEEYENIDLKIYTKRETAKYSLVEQKKGLTNIIFYIILAIFAYLTFVNWRQEKNLPKAMKLSLKTMLKSFSSFLKKLRWNHIKRIPRKIKLFINS